MIVLNVYPKSLIKQMSLRHQNMQMSLGGSQAALFQYS